MSKNEQDQTIRHILVMLDTSSHAVPMLELAVDLAARLGAELMCLYIEDVNLLRLTELPFSQEIGLFSATRRQLPAERLERQLRVQASQVRQALMTIAERKGVVWAFRVVRGAIPAEILKAAAETDVLLLGRQQLGAPTRTLVFRAPPVTLLLTAREVRAHRPILVVYDSSNAAQRALSVAAHLARSDAHQLVVALVSNGSGGVYQIQEQVESWLRTQRLTAHYRRLATLNLSDIVHLARLEGIGALVLPTTQQLLEAVELHSLLNDLNCPVVLVR